MRNKLYLDDMRSPIETDWVVVRKYDEFVDYIKNNGIPDLISFDHDLADEHIDYFKSNGNFRNPPDPQAHEFKEKTGYDCAKWLVDYCLDNGVTMKEVTVHSANPVGNQNIVSLINNFKKHMKQAPDCYPHVWRFTVEDK